jgi:hypothetical protein
MRKSKEGSDAIPAAVQAAHEAAHANQRVLALRFIEKPGMAELAMPTLNQGITAVEQTGLYRFDHCVPGGSRARRVITYAVFVRAGDDRAPGAAS